MSWSLLDLKGKFRLLVIKPRKNFWEMNLGLCLKAYCHGLLDCFVFMTLNICISCNISLHFSVYCEL